MFNFYDLSATMRSFFMGFIFAEVIASLSLIYFTFNRKKGIRLVPTVLCGVVSLSMTFLFASLMKASKLGLEEEALSKWICEQNFLYPLGIALVVLVILVLEFKEEKAYRRTTITAASIKESLDKLSTGLCISQENGKPILVNYKMNELHHELLGEELQNAEILWEKLVSGSVEEDVKAVKVVDVPCYQLKDGTVWAFTRKTIRNFVQITAADTTQLYCINKELEQKNQELSALNVRLKEYCDNVDEFIRSKERLETKINIHRELGQALLATRGFLREEGARIPVDMWEKNISVLRKEAKLTMEDPYKMFLQAANAIGVKLALRGTLPEDVEVRNLFVSAAVEALTNAVRYGKATTLFIEVTETAEYYKVSFKNDGKQPTTPIREGGGLGSLRKKVQRVNGKMSVLSQPEFELAIVLEKSMYLSADKRKYL